ncbi:MAG: hypothetical protein AAFO04_19385 [Cyanobacteria bacterium J06592_8]
MERLTPAQVRGLKIRCKLMQTILEFPGCTIEELIQNSGVNLSKRQVERHLLTLISDDLAKIRDGKIYMAETPLKIFKSQIAYICKQGIEKFKFNSAHYRKNH